jgi:hypothetical protein
VRLSLVIVFLATLAAASGAAALPATGDAGGLHIRVADGEWGEASSRQVEAVLRAVAEDLLARTGAVPDLSIVVSHTPRNPIVLYGRGENGEYRVLLHASGFQWDLYVYEFAHELCHILSNYDRNAADGVPRRNQWFEESLCEMASLYALETLGQRWQSQPPTPGWDERAAQLQRFFHRLVAERHRRLAPTESLAGWVRDNEPLLRRDPYQRDKDDLVGLALLPLFEGSSAGWRAVRYLNLDTADREAGFADYLRHWYDHAPMGDKAFVERVRELFSGEGGGLPATLSVSDSGGQ